MTTYSTSCGTSPRDVLAPNPLRDEEQEATSHRHHEADHAPAIWPERQDAQPVGERDDCPEQKEGTSEVTVEATTAGRIDDARRARHRERGRPQYAVPDSADEGAGYEHDQGQQPEYEPLDLSARQIALIRRRAIGHGQPPSQVRISTTRGT